MTAVFILAEIKAAAAAKLLETTELPDLS